MLKVCGYYASVGDSLTSGMHYDSRQNDSNAHTKKTVWTFGEHKWQISSRKCLNCIIIVFSFFFRVLKKSVVIYGFEGISAIVFSGWLLLY